MLCKIMGWIESVGLYLQRRKAIRRNYHDFVVHYHDGKKTYKLRYSEACNLADVFGGKVVYVEDGTVVFETEVVKK